MATKQNTRHATPQPLREEQRPPPVDANQTHRRQRKGGQQHAGKRWDEPSGDESDEMSRNHVPPQSPSTPERSNAESSGAKPHKPNRCALHRELPARNRLGPQND